MLINLHAHALTYGMFGHDPYWGPVWENDTLRVGDWTLGLKEAGKFGHAAEAFSRAKSLERMEQRGIDKIVFSGPSHMYMYWAGDYGTKYARINNDELAAFCADEPDKFHFWALVPMADPEAAVIELERAVEELGAVGMIMGGSNFGGREVWDDAYEPLWEKLVELDVPVFVHGYNVSATGAHGEDRYDATSIVGMNYYETLCIWHLICSGVLDRHPSLQFYVTHAGGYMPYHLGRLTQTNLTMAPDSVNLKPVDQYLDNFFFDPDVHEPVMRRALVDLIGVDRFVYGDNLGGSDNFQGDLTDGIDLSEEDREKIRSGNALRLLKRLAVEV